MIRHSRGQRYLIPFLFQSTLSLDKRLQVHSGVKVFYNSVVSHSDDIMAERWFGLSFEKSEQMSLMSNIELKDQLFVPNLAAASIVGRKMYLKSI